jgi:hypothetical protein
MIEREKIKSYSLLGQKVFSDKKLFSDKTILSPIFFPFDEQRPESLFHFHVPLKNLHKHLLIADGPPKMIRKPFPPLLIGMRGGLAFRYLGRIL